MVPMRDDRRLAACLLVAIMAIIGGACGRVALPPETRNDRSTVTMSGTGTVRQAPDVAMLRLTVESRASKPAVAQQRAAAIATALTARLHQFRLADQSIKTSSYALSRDYDYVKGQPVFRGWMASHVLDVRIEEISRLGDIIDAVESAGPITIDGPQFDLRSAATAYAQALKQAVADAREKADAAAQGSGARVVRVVSIDEQGATLPERKMFDGLASRAAPPSPPPTRVEQATSRSRRASR